MTGKDIHDYARSILGRRAEVASRMWRARPGTIAEAMQNGIRVSQFNVERILKAFLPEAIPESFAELKIPLKVTATDYFGHKLAVFADGDLHSALAASTAIPAVFRPVTRDGRLLIDGGIYNPVPFDLIEKDADIIIGVDVVGAPEEADRKQPTSVDLMFGATQLMMQSIIANKLKQCQPDILVRPAVSKYRVLDFLKIEALMSETVEIKDRLKREVEVAIERRSAKVEAKRTKTPAKS
jgi:NTE family protein